jgi:hypothetical protein
MPKGKNAFEARLDFEKESILEFVRTNDTIRTKATEFASLHCAHHKEDDHYGAYSKYDFERFICKELWNQRLRWKLNGIDEKTLTALLMMDEKLKNPLGAAAAEVFGEEVRLRSAAAFVLSFTFAGGSSIEAHGRSEKEARRECEQQGQIWPCSQRRRQGKRQTST